ncbi:MAG: pilus assembly protein PilP [Desulfobacterales bacterium]|jgi:type IV pilus assembly protein PilP
MKKYLIIICNFACLIGFLTALLGCDQTADKAATPKIVRKKIHMKTDKKARPPKTKSVTESKPAPKATPTVRQPDTDKQAPQPPLVAKKSERPAGGTATAAKPKPPVKPKSAISRTRQPGTQKQRVKTDIGKDAMASTSPETSAKSSAVGRPFYDPKGKIDPFEPLFREKPTVALRKKKRKRRTPRTPLEKIDLSQLKLVGIILASSGNRALVEEASGKGYVVKKGTYMGTNAGKVVKIEKDKVVVAEEYEDIRGNVVLRNKELKLPKPPGEL